jgi:hypothetical protein
MSRSNIDNDNPFRLPSPQHSQTLPNTPKQGKRFRSGFRMTTITELEYVLNGLMSHALSVRDVRVWAAIKDRTFEGTPPTITELKTALKKADRTHFVKQSIQSLDDYLKPLMPLNGHKRVIPRSVLRYIAQVGERADIAVALIVVRLAMPSQDYAFRLKQTSLADTLGLDRKTINRGVAKLVRCDVIRDCDPSRKGWNSPHSVKIHGKRFGFVDTILRNKPRVYNPLSRLTIVR